MFKKRTGTGLRTLNRKLSGQKLSEGKDIGGPGRLTDSVIDKLQTLWICNQG
jgi:hypothetical protein